MENGVKITQMPRASSVNNTTVIAGVSNGVNEQIPVNLLATKSEVYTKDETNQAFVAQTNAITPAEFEALWGA